MSQAAGWPGCGLSILLCLVSQSCPTLSDPMDCNPLGSSVHGDSPGKNTGVGCHVSSRGSFQLRDWTRSLTLSLYRLSHQGSPIQKPIANNWFCCGLWSGEIRNRGKYFFFLIKKMWSNIFVSQQKVSPVSPKKGQISNLSFSIELVNHKRLFLFYSFCYLIVSSKAI